ncbi:MAG: NAD(+) synthase [bacterium]|nr:NAD(+) synthase [bacterium]
MKTFNAKVETNKIIEFVRDYYQKQHVSGVILGISGGKDSAVVAALFVKALGKENVIGVMLPCYSKEEDKIDARLISDYYGFELINFDLTTIFDTFQEEVAMLGKFTEQETENSNINLKPRLRMASLYYLASLYSSIRKQTYLVAGTSNKCERYVGYFTKGGDSVYDIALIADFTVDEVIKIGECLQVPDKVLYKKPNDGLSNKTDEDKLGVKYSEIASFIEDEALVETEIAHKIKKLHADNFHKFYTPTYRR